jgi:hypothetical protein
MTELIINDVACDLTGDESIKFVLNIFDLLAISKRKGSRSLEINLPATVANRLALGIPEEINSLSNLRYRRLNARLRVNGVDQLIRFATIENITDTYNVRLYDIQTEFLAGINDLKLSDLDLIEYNHFWTFDNVVNGRHGVAAYAYPLIDYMAEYPNANTQNTTRSISPGALYPAVKFEFLLNKICAEQGYTLNNEIANITGYPADGLIIPINEVFNRDEDVKKYEAAILTTSPTANPPAAAFGPVTYDAVDAAYLYKYWDATTQTLNQVFPRFVDEIDADVVIVMNVTNTTGVDKTLSIRIDIANVVFNSSTHLIPAGATQDITFNFPAMPLRHNPPTFANIGVYISALPAAAIVVNNSSIAVSNAVLYRQTHSEIIYSPDTTLPSIQSFISFPGILPDMTQGKLFSEYCKITGGIIFVNEIDKVISIFPFQSINNNIGSAVDWSAKLDFTNKPAIVYRNDSFGQKSTFVYKEDETVTKPVGTDGTILIDDTNLEAEVEVLKVDFAATESVVRFDDLTVPNIKMILSEVDSGRAVNMEDVVLRVLVLKYYDSADLDPVGDLTYDDTTATSVVSTNIPIPYFINENEIVSLGFDKSLIPVFYGAIEDILVRFVMITAGIRIDETDLLKLNFLNPIYIEYFNAYFYISSIQGYEPGANTTSEVNLIKLF